MLGEPDADGSVSARSSYLVLQATDGFALQPIIAGRYVDRFEQEGTETDAGRDGGWYFARRHFAIDLAGDLSQHWSGPTG